MTLGLQLKAYLTLRILKDCIML